MKLIYTKSTHSFHQFIITGSLKPKFGVIKTISNIILQFFKLNKKNNQTQECYNFNAHGIKLSIPSHNFDMMVL
jgi:hypothetical protein